MGLGHICYLLDGLGGKRKNIESAEKVTVTTDMLLVTLAFSGSGLI